MHFKSEWDEGERGGQIINIMTHFTLLCDFDKLGCLKHERLERESL